MKCTRHRCQVAPLSTVAIACFSPSCASEMTRRTPLSPRLTRLRRNAVQNARSSDGPTSIAEHLALALAGDADRDDRRLADDAAVDPHLVVRRIDPEVRMLARERAASETPRPAGRARRRSARPRTSRRRPSPSAFIRSSTFRVETPCT